MNSARISPTPTQCDRVACVLIDSARVCAHLAPETADDYPAVAAMLRAWAKQPPAPQPRITAGKDRKAAQLAVHEWLLRFGETWQGEKPPSLRQTRESAKAAGIGPRDFVDAAHRAQWPLAARQ